METRRILMRSLAVAVVIVSVIWTGEGAAADTQVKYSCCTKVSSDEVTDPILNFRLQRESLPCLWAVIFETERGDFCIDPRQRWVQKKVKQFFRAQRNKHLTSTAPPTSTDSSSVTNV